MPYKSPEKQREAVNNAVKRIRSMKIIIELKKVNSPIELKEYVKLFDDIQALAEKYPCVQSVDMNGTIPKRKAEKEQKEAE